MQPEPLDPIARVSRSAILALFLILALFFMLASTYSVVIPAWECPDEVGHFAYVLHLVTQRSLPVQRVGELGEAHQPPLYYVLAAAAAGLADVNDSTGSFQPNPRFIWARQGGSDVNASLHNSSETFPFRGQALALHLARAISVCIACVTVALTCALGWEAFPRRPQVGLLAAALVAFNPQFLFISAAVNNDNLLTLAATGAWLQLLRAQKQPQQWRRWVQVSLWLSAAVLTKLGGLVVVVVAAAVLATSAASMRNLKLLIKGALALGLPLLLATGWWFAHNQILYEDPMGRTMFEQVFAAVLRIEPLQSSDVGQFFGTQVDSFWGVFGWMNVRAPAWFYVTVRLFWLLALFGIAFFVARRLAAISEPQKRAFALFAAAVVTQEAYLLWAITRFNESWYQGRYLFPIIGPAMTLTSAAWLDLLPKRVQRPALAVSALALVGTAIFLLWQVVQPAYASVPLPKWRLWFLPSKTGFVFGDRFRLRGYDTRPAPDGAQVEVTLYWQAVQPIDFDYSAFVHVIDESHTLLAQKDHAPGEDRRYPPTAWQTGDIIADPHVIAVPPGVNLRHCRFRVGLYNWQSGQQLLVTLMDGTQSGFVILEPGY